MSYIPCLSVLFVCVCFKLVKRTLKNDAVDISRFWSVSFCNMLPCVTLLTHNTGPMWTQDSMPAVWQSDIYHFSVLSKVIKKTPNISSRFISCSWRIKDQLDVTCYFICGFSPQHGHYVYVCWRLGAASAHNTGTKGKWGAKALALPRSPD